MVCVQHWHRFHVLDTWAWRCAHTETGQVFTPCSNLMDMVVRTHTCSDFWIPEHEGVHTQKPVRFLTPCSNLMDMVVRTHTCSDSMCLDCNSHMVLPTLLGLGLHSHCYMFPFLDLAWWRWWCAPTPSLAATSGLQNLFQVSVHIQSTCLLASHWIRFTSHWVWFTSHWIWFTSNWVWFTSHWAGFNACWHRN